MHLTTCKWEIKSFVLQRWSQHSVKICCYKVFQLLYLGCCIYCNRGTVWNCCEIVAVSLPDFQGFSETLLFTDYSVEYDLLNCHHINAIVEANVYKIILFIMQQYCMYLTLLLNIFYYIFGSYTSSISLGYLVLLHRLQPILKAFLKPWPLCSSILWYFQTKVLLIHHCDKPTCTVLTRA